MLEQQLDKNTSLEKDNSSTGEMEIDLMDIFRKIIGIRKTLYKAAGIGLIVGLVVAFSIPKQYTVRVTLSPEMGSSKANSGIAGLAASFLGSNAAMNESPDALNASLSTDIVSSTPFLLELFDIKVPVSKNEMVTLESYLEKQSSPWWNNVIGLPGMAIEGIKSLFTDDEDNHTDFRSQKGTIELSKVESEKIKFLKKSIVANMDKKTAITSISVTLQKPKVTAVVADSVVRKLQEYIITYRTSKSKEDCAYLEKLFKERQKEYYVAQQKYAHYVDTHDNLILQSIRSEQERLQNDMNLAYQVYSQVANQLQVARAKVQEEKPVFAVVEPAVVPLFPTGMGKMTYMLLFAFLAVFCTMGWLLLGKDLMRKFNRKE